MKIKPNRAGRAFSIVEVMVVVAIIAVLLAVLIPALSSAKGEARATTCRANLKQVLHGFQMYAAAHRGYLPAAEHEIIWFQPIGELLQSPDVFTCPDDPDPAARMAGVSYMWRNSFVVLDPVASLAGKRMHGSSGELLLVFDALPGWHEPDTTQAVALNGSVRRLSAADFQQNLARPAD